MPKPSFILKDVYAGTFHKRLVPNVGKRYMYI